MKRWEREDEGWHCSDRWARKLPDGSEVFAGLFACSKPRGWAMELRFTSDDPRLVGPIADEIMEVLDRHGGELTSWHLDDGMEDAA